MRRQYITLVIATLLALVGCSSPESKVSEYGVEKFQKDLLSFLEDEKLHADLKTSFPRAYASRFMAGVVLVIEDSSRYREGIYVDPESLSGLGGSGLSVDRWGPRIGWVEIEKRTPNKT